LISSSFTNRVNPLSQKMLEKYIVMAEALEELEEAA
jgi:hypothetical protein